MLKLHTFPELPEKYRIYILVALALITLIPLLYLLGHIFTKHGRAEIFSRPLLFIYFIFAPLYIFTFWFGHKVLVDYFWMNTMWQILIYCLTCFAVILKTDPPE